MQTHFGSDPKFDNLRAPQVRLAPFDAVRLAEVGRRVRDLYPAQEPDRVQRRIDDRLIDGLVKNMTSAFGGKVDIVPRLFLRDLVDRLDRVDQHPDYDPAADLSMEVDESLLRAEERAARHGLPDPDDASDGQDPDGDILPRRLS